MDAEAPAKDKKGKQQGKKQRAASSTSSDKDIRQLRIQKVHWQRPCVHWQRPCVHAPQTTSHAPHTFGTLTQRWARSDIFLMHATGAGAERRRAGALRIHL